jgi:capsid protein
MVRTAKARTPWYRRLASGVVTALGYHVVDQSRNRRQVSSSNLKTEDETLKRRDREKLIETARDADRNWALAGWMVRKHLDFVATQKFHCRAADRGLRKDVEEYVESRMAARVCDATRRHDLDAWLRLAESRAVLDGDVFGVRLATGQLQAVEGIYCRDPGRSTPAYPSRDRWVQGVYEDDFGGPLAYCFHGRRAGDAEAEEIVPADRVLQHAYFGRFHQSRGVGLIAPGLATLVDTYEICDYAVAKAKVAQLFALALYRQGTTSPAPTYQAAQTDPSVQPSAGATAQPKYEIDFGKGPQFLDLEPGERAEFLSTNTPGIDPQFLRLLLIVTLSALDMPYCWLDASDANFFGNRGALILYLQSARAKRKRLIDLRKDWTEWQLTRAYATGDLLRPAEPVKYVWQPAGIPFWNPSQEVNAHLDAIDGCLDTRTRVIQETLGEDFDDLLEQAKYEHDRLAEMGLLKDRYGKLQTVPAAAADKNSDPNWQRQGSE